MEQLKEMIADAKVVGISGHVRPDADCIGSCLALYNYLLDNYPDLQVDVRLETPDPKFLFLKNSNEIKDAKEEKQYDLYFCLDCGSEDRLGDNAKYFLSAKKKICFDHHISNTGFADYNIVEPEISSTCELLFAYLDDEKISKEVAEALYTGIIGDTGAFRHSCTSKATLQVAGALIDHGIDFSKIVNDTYFGKTYLQNQILGRALLESVTLLDGKIIYTVVNKQEKEFYGVSGNDLDGIVDQLIMTKGVECAIFIHESGELTYKVSMRSKGLVNVSQIAQSLGGGGHVRAAGCTLMGNEYDVINNVVKKVAAQLKDK